MVEKANLILVYKTIKATGIMLLRKNDGALLLQHRDNIKKIRYPNMWGTPGGHVKSNETYIKCAKREMLEETGYKMKKLNYFKTFIDQFEENFEVRKVKLYWDIYDNIQDISCNEGQEMRFILPKEIPKIKIVKIVFESWKSLLKIL
jgi:ADP-ribose pyrophosphatase YjhB (NUDIX family)